MKIEVRADKTVHISGYVNAVGRESRAVITPHGKVNEVIEPGAFGRAIDRAPEVKMTIDHGEHAVASTKEGLTLYEDNIGLRAEAIITDEETVEDARQGKIKGWSFGMRHVVDEMEERTSKLPLRRIKDFDIDHITLAVKKLPVYSATSVELRAEDILDHLELRSEPDNIITTEEKKKPVYETLEGRMRKIKGA